MRCNVCNTENKDASKNCKKCGKPLLLSPIWSPTWKWHAKTLGMIYVGLILLYFFLNSLLKPYLRELPPEVTPWLKKAGAMHP